MSPQASDVKILPVSKDRWDDLEELFGPSGAYSGCWCMWWRIKSKEFESNGNRGNKAAMQGIVARNEVPGLLAIKAGQAIGWISLGPREAFGRLSRSPILKAVDDKQVWSIVCFFIRPGYREQGVATQLLDGAGVYAKSQGADCIEAYPIDTVGERQQQANLFTGTQSMFEAAGFSEIARRKAARPIYRKNL